MGGGRSFYETYAASTMAPSLSRDEVLAVRTIIGEARGEGEKGWEGVADVIRNRSKQSGKGFGDVVLAPGQFEPWSSRKQELDSYDPNSPIFQQVSKVVLPVLRGERMGPAKDATHFYSPKSQAALGRPAPSWDNGKGIDIGNHRFFNLGYSRNGAHGTEPTNPYEAFAAQTLSAPVNPYEDYAFDSLTPTEAAPAQPVQVAKPAIESPDTINAQITSMRDPQTPRAAVLTTDPSQNAVFGQMGGVVGVPMKEGILWVDIDKAKRKYKLKTPEEITRFVQKNPNAMNTLGVRVEGHEDTSTGVGVHSTVDGTEVNSSKVSTPEAAQAQAELDQANHPGAESEILPAQDIVAQRETMNAQMDAIRTTTPQPEPTPEMMAGLAEAGKAITDVPVLPDASTTSVPVKQAQKPAIKPKSGTVTANVEIGAPVLDDSRVSEQPTNWKAGDKDMTDDDILKGEEVFTVDLKGVPKDQRASVVQQQVASRLSKKYGIPIDKVPAITQTHVGTDDDAEITIPRSVIAEMGGNPVEKVRAEQQENYQPIAQKAFDNQLKSDRDKIPAYENSVEGQPGEDPLLTQARANVQGSTVGIQGGDYDADVRKEYERLKKWTLTGDEKAEAQGVGGNLAQQTGGAAKSGIVGAGGRTLQSLAGALGYVAVPGMIPEEWQIALSKHGQKMSLAEETEAEKNPGLLNKGIRLVSGLAGDTPRFLLLSKLPGGMTSMFAVDAGLQSAGRGDRPETVAGNVAKGAVTGKIFGSASRWARAAEAGVLTKLLSGVTPDAKSLLAKFAGTGTRLATRDSQRLTAKIFGIGTKIGSVAGGTAAQAKFEGGTTEQSLESGLTNALLVLALEHNGDAADGAKKLAGKIFRGKLGDKTKTVTIDENGDIHELTKDVPDKLVDVNIALTPKEVDAKISKVMENYDAEGKRIESTTKSSEIKERSSSKLVVKSKETVKLDTLNKIPVVKKAPESVPVPEKAPTPVVAPEKPSAPVVGERALINNKWNNPKISGGNRVDVQTPDGKRISGHITAELEPITEISTKTGDLPGTQSQKKVTRQYTFAPDDLNTSYKVSENELVKPELRGWDKTKDEFKKDNENDEYLIERKRIDLNKIRGVEYEGSKVEPSKSTDVETYKKKFEEGSEFPPVRVKEDANGGFVLTDGHRRVQSAKELGHNNIEAIVSKQHETGFGITYKDVVKQAIADGRYEQAIKDGKMTRERVNQIIESAGTTAKSEYGATNKLVTIDRAKEIREALSKKLKASSNTASAGLPIDAETIKLISELGLYHIEAGSRSFAKFAKALSEDGIELAESKLKAIYANIKAEHNLPDMDDVTNFVSEVKEAKSPTSLRNEIVDKERVARGLSPVMKEASRDFGEAWNQATEKIDKNPHVQDDLIHELASKPRAVTDVENAILLHRKVDLQNQFERAAKELTDDPTNLEARATVARLSDDLQQIDSISTKVGTETGRGLNARKMMLNDDFTLASLETKKRAALGGRELTEVERTNLQDVANDYKARNEALETHLAEREHRIAEMQTKIDLQAEKLEAKESSPISDAADRLVAKAEKRATAARERLAKRGNVFSAGIPLDAYKDLTDIGVYHILKGARDFTKFSEKMIKEFGEKITPHLQKIFDSASKSLEANEQDKLVKAAEMRLTNQIAKLQKEIDSKTREVNVKSTVTSPKIEELKAQRDKLKEEHQGIFPKVKVAPTEAAKLKTRATQLANQIHTLNEAITNQTKIEREQKVASTSPEVQKLIEKRDALKADYEKIFPKEGVTNEQKLKGYHTRTETRITELQRKIAEKDFSKKERKPLALDEKGKALKVEVEKVKREFDRELEKDRLSQRNWWEKGLDLAANWQRMSLLSYPSTLGKLTSAAIQRMVYTPIEEVVGAGISKLPYAKQVAAKAPREGGLNVKAEASALKDFWMKGLKDAGQVVKRGESDLDVEHGKQEYPQNWMSYMGAVWHGALKAPVKRAEYARSFEKRTAQAIRDGLDVSDPVIQMNISLDAYKDANRAIFMQDNAVVNAYRQTVRSLERPDKLTGKPTVARKVGATALKVLFPIVKVPTNFIGEVLTHVAGIPVGGYKLAKAFKNGIDTLPPEEADVIMRHLKKGSVGLAYMAIGFFLPDNFGGFYQPGKKRDEKDVGAGKLKAFGVEIPSWLLHAPPLELMQLGSTMRRVLDERFTKKEKDRTIPAAIMAGAVGLAEEVPFIKESAELSKVLDARTREDYFGELLKSRLVPGLISQPTGWADRKNGEAVKRDPETIWQHIESGLPFLRQNVPEKEDKDSLGDQVRAGKMSKADARKKLEKQYKAGEITDAAAKSQLKDIDRDEFSERVTKLESSTESDFKNIEQAIKDADTPEKKTALWEKLTKLRKAKKSSPKELDQKDQLDLLIHKLEAFAK